MSGHREFCKKLQGVLREFGIEKSWVETGRRGHPRLWFEFGGRKHFYVIPCSPSSKRSVNHCMSDLRRYVRTQGGVKDESAVR